MNYGGWHTKSCTALARALTLPSEDRKMARGNPEGGRLMNFYGGSQPESYLAD